MNKYNLILLFPLLFIACTSGKKESGDAATSTGKEREIREYNIDVAKEQTKNRFPCDTIALKEYIMENYPPGTYLMENEPSTIYGVPKSAVIYFNDGANFILALIARSKESERFIEKKNVQGYESSFVTLDSTKLGTAFFYLTLFECKENNFEKIWEAEVPIHGGFSKMSIKTWTPKNIKYVELFYEDGIISGHRKYNFFLVDGWRKPPHLLETYTGIVHKRTLANINNDKYPDYYEYRFIEDSMRIRVRDSIPFYWSEKRQLYITDKNPRWFRKY
ncbi:hypothetical protein VJY32_03010 [Ignavibacteria bacterium 4148-Me]|uniref:hypothetical protein n=1 Tax=Rosettibacter primus TaxID=3111523 RepID=UPI00336C01AA